MKLTLKRKDELPAALQLRSKRGEKNGSDDRAPTFAELVQEAVSITRELNTARTVRACRLSAAAMLREILALAGRSEQRVTKLRRALEAREPGLSDCKTSLRRMTDFLEGENWTSPGSDPRRLRFLWSDETEAELSVRGLMPPELLAVAAQITAERHPEAFGTCEDSAVHARELEHLSKRQGELFDLIGKSWSANDCDIAPADREGRSLITFRGTAGAVAVGPSDSAGERLVNFLLANRR